MRRCPPSQSCQPRSVQWISRAASVCVSPAASRAERICSGVGFAAGVTRRLRLGWLDTISARQPANARLGAPPETVAGSVVAGKLVIDAHPSLALPHCAEDRKSVV